MLPFPKKSRMRLHWLFTYSFYHQFICLCATRYLLREKNWYIKGEGICVKKLSYCAMYWPKRYCNTISLLCFCYRYTARIVSLWKHPFKLNDDVWVIFSYGIPLTMVWFFFFRYPFRDFNKSTVICKHEYCFVITKCFDIFRTYCINAKYSSL